MLKVVLGAIVCFAACSAAFAQLDGPPDPVAAIQAPVRLETRFSHNRMILVQIKVQDARNGWFALDTGARSTALDPAFAKELALRKRPLGGIFRWGVTDDICLDLAPDVSTLVDVAALLPLRERFATVGLTVDGLLGVDTLSKFVVKIDYVAETVELIPRSDLDEHAHAYAALPVIFIPGRHALTSVLLDPGTPEQSGPFELVVDTGAPCGATIFADTNCAQHLKAQHADPVHTNDGITGIGGGDPSTCYGWCDVPISLPDASPLGSTSIEIIQRGAVIDLPWHGLLGLDFLAAHSPVVLDIAQGVIFLGPTSALASGGIGGARGMMLQCPPGRTGDVWVTQVRSGSSAETAGVKLHDRIVAVDGVPTGDDAINTVTRYLDQNRAREVRLSLRRRYDAVDVRIAPAKNCFE